ncbi:hypothetical protein EDB81DRAFT_810240 [Dactylonectria macrodidyma]|uniref:Uncharacterized protein n=1 Tax=Dactylonectria macrodidyma TaxID=307937 RepID=A0A9P9IMI8_9HYPO|nr:hypothetical protein EDB81DRAFT_810240 [Dactylonectria macrodidyma]
MFRAKGSTREVVGRPQWPAIETIEEPSILNPSDVPDDPAEAPVVKNERGWTRWPVAVFATLVYWPIIKPLDAFLSNPACFLLLLVVFLYGCLPFMITSGFLSNVMAGKEAKINAI